jgi:hypothetical protein
VEIEVRSLCFIASTPTLIKNQVQSAESAGHSGESRLFARPLLNIFGIIWRINENNAQELLPSYI